MQNYALYCGAPSCARGQRQHTIIIAALVSLLALASMSFAVDVPNGTWSGTIDLPGTSFVSGALSFDGSNFATPGSPPTTTAEATMAAFAPQAYANAHFEILSGFSSLSTTVFDDDISGTISLNDYFVATIGSGSFRIITDGQVLVTGSFTSASLEGEIGATTGTLSSQNTNGLSLTSGPGFDFDNTQVQSIVAQQLNAAISSVPGGGFGASGGSLSAGPGSVFTGASLSAFGLSDMDMNINGDFEVVPEPTTLALLGMGTLAMIRRRSRKQN